MSEPTKEAITAAAELAQMDIDTSYEVIMAGLVIDRHHAPLRAKLAKAMEMLKRLEWSKRNGMIYCPICVGWKGTGHRPDCALAAVIKGEI